MKNTPEFNQRRAAARKEIREQARNGSAEAKALLAKQKQAEKASAAKAKAEGRSYNRRHNQREAERMREYKQLGAAGDTKAQALYDKYRATNNASCRRYQARKRSTPPSTSLSTATPLPPPLAT